MEVVNFLIAIFLGALIGLQREYEQQHTKITRFAGIRTFILISLLGAVLGYLALNVFQSYTIVIVGFIGIILFAVASYYITYLRYKDNTATTEISSIFVFILGLMTTAGFLKEAIIFGVIIGAFLTFKRGFHNFALKMKKQELFAIIEFAIIALVVLPLIPRQAFSPLDVPILKDILLAIGINSNILAQLNIFNFYHIWLFIILVSAIGFIGYILTKFLPAKKGFGLTGLVGGLISSTAVTLSMSAESKRNKKVVNPFVIAVVLASATSFIRVLVEVIVVNKSLLSGVIIPIGLMGISGYLLAFLIYIKKGKKKEQAQKVRYKQPFDIVLALKFGLFFTLVLFLSKLGHVLFGPNALYGISVLSGLADMDAITLSMASLSAAGEIPSAVAALSIIIAASANTLVKAGMAWIFGEKKFAAYISIIAILILMVGWGAVLLI
jgi:uncharacterized membrane protein (DUF4010 family)